MPEFDKRIQDSMVMRTSTEEDFEDNRRRWGLLMRSIFDNFVMEPLRAMDRVGGAMLGKNEATIEDVIIATSMGVMGGFPGGGSGVANVGKKNALKQLSRSFKQLARQEKHEEILKTYPKLVNTEDRLKLLETKAARDYAKETPELLNFDPVTGDLIPTTHGKQFASLTKQVRRTPQEALDPVDELILMLDPKMRKKYEGLYTTKRSKSKVRIKLGVEKDVLPHELAHARYHGPTNKRYESGPAGKAEVLTEAAFKRVDQLSREFQSPTKSYSVRPTEAVANRVAGLYSKIDSMQDKPLTDKQWVEIYRVALRDVIQKVKKSPRVAEEALFDANLTRDFLEP